MSTPRLIRAFGAALVALTLETYVFYLIDNVVRPADIQGYLTYVLLPYVVMFVGTVICLAGYVIPAESA